MHSKVYIEESIKRDLFASKSFSFSTSLKKQVFLLPEGDGFSQCSLSVGAQTSGLGNCVTCVGVYFRGRGKKADSFGLPSCILLVVERVE